MQPHAIAHHRLEPRPVLIRPPRDDLAIPRPAMLVGAHMLGELALTYEVRLPDDSRATILPAWLDLRRS